MKINKWTLILFVLLAFTFTGCRHTNFSYKKIENGIVLKGSGFHKRILFYGSKLVRISVAKDEKFTDRESLVVIANPNLEPEVSDKSDIIVVKSQEIKLEVDKTSGAISFFTKNGKPILLEYSKGTHTLTPKEIDNDKGFSVTQKFKLTSDEGVYGLGQYQDGYMNYRNREVKIVQANKVSVVPFLISTQNYGILWDNYSKSIFKDNKNGATFSAELADCIDYYFVAGDNMDDVISGYRKLTGKAPMFPKSAYGFWQSKERYTSFSELLDVVKRYRKLNIPIDNIVQDWRYWGDKKKWSSMYFDKKTYPNAKKYIKQIHDLNVDLMVSIWPSLGGDSRIYKDMEKIGALYPSTHWCGGKIYDAYNPKARKIYFDHIQKGLFDLGVDALWMDGTEPEVSHTDTRDYTEKRIKEIGKNHIGSMARYLNTFSLQTTKGTYEGQRNTGTKKRVYTLTRSAFAGQQRYGAVTWSGDIVSNWKTFRKQISAGVNFCMAGIPYWTHDIGAFFPSGRGGKYPDGINDPAYRELYVRWFQFGAFSPIFRSHGTGTPREVWRFGKPGNMMFDALVKADNLRYRLMPYIYSNAWKITNQDYTFMRGLPMDFSHDKNTYSIDDQFMFGESILVKPVTKAMYHTIKSQGKVIDNRYLQGDDGVQGLKVEYFNGRNFETKVGDNRDKCIDFNWSGGPPQNLSETNYSIRWSGYVVPEENGKYEIGLTGDDGYRMWLNDKLVVDSWKEQGATYRSKELNLKKGKKYKIKVEYFQSGGGAEIKLSWITPSYRKNNLSKNLSKEVSTYLPVSEGWYDLWSGEFHQGGNHITKEYNLDVFPLFVKAGSIIPVGPFIQYTTEKPAKEIELRVYAGSDAEFTLYEDENDGYNYEKGVYSTIKFDWNDDSKTLTIDKRNGEFPGMIKERVFRVVKVGSGNGNGLKDSRKYEKITYKGEKISVKL